MIMIPLAIFYPPLKYIWSCFGLFLQAQKGNTYFTELAERVQYGSYVRVNVAAPTSPPLLEPLALPGLPSAAIESWANHLHSCHILPFQPIL